MHVLEIFRGQCVAWLILYFFPLSVCYWSFVALYDVLSRIEYRPFFKEIVELQENRRLYYWCSNFKNLIRAYSTYKARSTKSTNVMAIPKYKRCLVFRQETCLFRNMYQQLCKLTLIRNDKRTYYSIDK